MPLGLLCCRPVLAPACLDSPAQTHTGRHLQLLRVCPSRPDAIQTRPAKVTAARQCLSTCSTPLAVGPRTKLLVVERAVWHHGQHGASAA